MTKKLSKCLPSFSSLWLNKLNTKKSLSTDFIFLSHSIEKVHPITIITKYNKIEIMHSQQREGAQEEIISCSEESRMMFAVEVKNM